MITGGSTTGEWTTSTDISSLFPRQHYDHKAAPAGMNATAAFAKSAQSGLAARRCQERGWAGAALGLSLHKHNQSQSRYNMSTEYLRKYTGELVQSPIRSM